MGLGRSQLIHRRVTHDLKYSFCMIKQEEEEESILLVLEKKMFFCLFEKL
jgi:hypothetical protein